MSGHAAAHVNDIPELDDGRGPMRPVRHHFGIAAFGINARTARNTGDRIINEHEEEQSDSHEELYLVTEGRRLRARPRASGRSCGHVRLRAAGRQANGVRGGPATTIVSIGGTPGKPDDPVGWELWPPLRSRYEAGEYAEVADRLRELVEAHPQYSLLFYNLACCESLAGRTAQALDHLRRAVEMSEQFRAYAKNDSDLDAIREEPAFEQLIGE